MKRFITIVLTLAMMLTLFGCKTKTTSSTITIVEDETSSENNQSDNNNSSGTEDSSTTDSSNQSQSGTSSNDTDDTQQVVVDYNTVVEVDLCDDVIRGYLDAKTPSQQYAFLSQYDTMVLDHQNLPLRWAPDGSPTYTLYISENSDFSNAYTTPVAGKYDSGELVLNKGATFLYPGKTYYWKVLGTHEESLVRGGGKIRIKNEPVRWIKLDGVSNARDMGGWKTESGKTVNYGKIYRGAMLDKITSTGIDQLKYLGIKTDLDIRSTQSWDKHGAVAGTGLNYHFVDTSAHYDYVLGSDQKPTAEIKKNYPEIFRILADESNYPIYMHCNYGNDRTGSMAFILNGLLGVNYEDLTRDYEITSYAFSHDRRWRGDGTGGTFAPDDLIQHNISNSDVDGRWGMMNKAFMESQYCTDGKLSTAIENFLLDAGVKQEHIDAYKKIMLG